MDGNQIKYRGQVEINDLIGNAVNNAVARRNQAIDSEDSLSALCDEEAASVAGGGAGGQTIRPTIAGGIRPTFPPEDGMLA